MMPGSVCKIVEGQDRGTKSCRNLLTSWRRWMTLLIRQVASHSWSPTCSTHPVPLSSTVCIEGESNNIYFCSPPIALTSCQFCYLWVCLFTLMLKQENKILKTWGREERLGDQQAQWTRTDIWEKQRNRGVPCEEDWSLELSTVLKQ